MPAVLLAALALSGCNQPPAVNPWRDDSIPQSEWTTPSEQGIYAANRETTQRHRGHEQLLAPTVDPQTPHYPLWWEDPFEDKGDENCTFAWTWQDYFAMPYSLGRYMVNTVGFPVSAVVQPPCTPMISDGCLSPNRPHDAKKGCSPDPTATASDFTYGHPCEVAAADEQAAGPTQTAPAP